jgi:hypothetical protein
MDRRRFLLLAFAGQESLLVSVNVMFDQGAHAGKGLSDAERKKFAAYQERARREFAVSGIRFDIQTTEGVYLRTHGYSEIPDQFLVLRKINVFVTDTLRLDVDSNRTGGASIGPRPSAPGVAGSRFYKTFLGLRDAGEGTLAHEYAHHFAMDTHGKPSTKGNLWADLRNDYLLWRQRRGVPIPEFRACANAEWVRRV